MADWGDMEPANESTERPRPLQFSLRNLFALTASVCLILALVVQLRHVGFVVSCCFAGIAIGFWFQKRRLLFASITSLLVFTITYLACWVQLGSVPDMRRPGFTNDYLMLKSMGESLSEYAKKHGEYPAVLADVTEIMPQRDLRDSWDHPFYYRRTESGFVLASLGRDGALGGHGLDADLRYGDTWNIWTMRLTLYEFLFETESSAQVFAAALLASIASGGIWFATPGELRMKHVAIQNTVTTIFAVSVAVFLAAFYVAASQSGH